MSDTPIALRLRAFALSPCDLSVSPELAKETAELLEELEGALKEIRTVGDNKMTYRSDWVAAVARADAALKKARGQ